MTNIFF